MVISDHIRDEVGRGRGITLGMRWGGEGVTRVALFASDTCVQSGGLFSGGHPTGTSCAVWVTDFYTCVGVYTVPS